MRRCFVVCRIEVQFPMNEAFIEAVVSLDTLRAKEVRLVGCDACMV